MNHFTPFSALVGGALVGFAATALLLFDGRLAGVSGIVAGLVPQRRDGGDAGWRWLFLAGLVSGGLFVRFVTASAFDGPRTSLPELLLAAWGRGSRVAARVAMVCAVRRASRGSRFW